jgi:hypothetical protein
MPTSHTSWTEHPSEDSPRADNTQAAGELGAGLTAAVLVAMTAIAIDRVLIPVATVGRRRLGRAGAAVLTTAAFVLLVIVAVP